MIYTNYYNLCTDLYGTPTNPFNSPTLAHVKILHDDGEQEKRQSSCALVN